MTHSDEIMGHFAIAENECSNSNKKLVPAVTILLMSSMSDA
jgi:hypothetical protein